MQTFLYADPQGDESWDFVDDEDLLLSFAPSARAEVETPSMAHLPALGPTPSEAEAADATRLLHHSLQQFREVSGNGIHTVPCGEHLRVLEAPSSSQPTNTRSVTRSQGDISVSAASLVAAARANAAHHRSALVTQALELFSTNDSVQRAVRSLACDPSVWRAVSNNPDVRRLINGPPLLPPGSSSTQQQQQVTPHVRETTLQSQPNAAPTLTLRLLHVVQGILQKLSDIKYSFIGGLVRLLGLQGAEEGGDGQDHETNKHLMPGIVTILVLVIAIIVLKRPILV